MAVGHTECAIANLSAAHQVLNNSRRCGTCRCLQMLEWSEHLKPLIAAMMHIAIRKRRVVLHH
jgi:hypothetical protein